MGIEPSLLLPRLVTPQVVVGAQKLRAQLAAAECVVASVDTLEGLCGMVTAVWASPKPGCWASSARAWRLRASSALPE